jgi:hypothetical protein
VSEWSSLPNQKAGSVAPDMRHSPTHSLTRSRAHLRPHCDITTLEAAAALGHVRYVVSGLKSPTLHRRLVPLARVLRVPALAAQGIHEYWGATLHVSPKLSEAHSIC